MRLSKYAALICCAFLLGCSSDDSNDAAEPDTSLPYIGDVYSSIYHFHPTYWTKKGLPEQALAFRLDFQTQPQGESTEMAEIYVRYSDEEFMTDLEERVNLVLDDSSDEEPDDSSLLNLNDEFIWQVLGGASNVPLETFYVTENDEFVTRLVHRYIWDRTDPLPLRNDDLIPLKNYAVHAFDQSGNEVVRYFDFKGFQGEPREGKTYVYRTGYASPTFEGLLALETMTFTRNLLTFNVDAPSETFVIEFTHRDKRARNYKVLFYGPAPDHAHLGTADFQSHSIFNTPLVSGRRTRLVIPFDEIVLEGDAQIEQIEGIHVVLADTLFEKELSEGVKTANYYGYSQYCRLAQPNCGPIPVEPVEPEVPVDPELPVEPEAPAE